MIFKITAKTFTVFMILSGLQTTISTVYASEEKQKEEKGTPIVTLEPVERQNANPLSLDESTQNSTEVLEQIPITPQKNEAPKKGEGKGKCSLL